MFRHGVECVYKKDLTFEQFLAAKGLQPPTQEQIEQFKQQVMDELKKEKQ